MRKIAARNIMIWMILSPGMGDNMYQRKTIGNQNEVKRRRKTHKAHRNGARVEPKQRERAK